MIAQAIKFPIYLKILIGLFFVFLLFDAITIVVQQKSIVPLVENIGGRFAFTTLEVQQWSLGIIANGGVYQRSDNFWEGIFDFIKAMFTIYNNLFILGLWIFIIFKLWSYMPGNNGVFLNLILSIITFFVIQMLFLSLFKEGNKFELIMIPFYAFKDLFLALPYVYKPISGKIVQLTPELNITS